VKREEKKKDLSSSKVKNKKNKMERRYSEKWVVIVLHCLCILIQKKSVHFYVLASYLNGLYSHLLNILFIIMQNYLICCSDVSDQSHG
jgi:hypothetical protein